MKILGLTGPSGSGKAIVGRAFLSRGIPVLDTDAVYHGWIARPTPCTEALASAFGNGILAPDGSVDRPSLAATVFLDDGKREEKLATLNRITHAFVLESCDAWLTEQETMGAKAAVIDAPLLIEAGLDRRCDAVIAVLAPRALRLSRIVARDGISEEAAQARIASQKQDDFYREKASFVFVNDGDPSAAEPFVESVIETLINV